MENIYKDKPQDTWEWNKGCEYSTIVLPFPPSVNHYWALIPMGRSARMIVGRKGRLFREKVKQIIGDIKCKISKLSIRIMAYPPDKRKRDLDNLLKATLDSLQHAGLYDDDFQIDDLHIRRSDEIVRDGKILVYIREL